MIFDFNHLKKAKVGYFNHGFRILKISFSLALLAVAGIIHAVLPFILVETVTNGVKKIEAKISGF